MIFPEEILSMGINAPIEHQRVISKLITGLGNLFYVEKSIDLEPLPETMLDPGQTSPVPDVLLHDHEQHTSPVIIEVCHSAGLKGDLKKAIKLVEEYEYGIKEAFVYDYKEDKWYKYSKGGLVRENDSYSSVLAVTLAELLK